MEQGDHQPPAVEATDEQSAPQEQQAPVHQQQAQQAQAPNNGSVERAYIASKLGVEPVLVDSIDETVLLRIKVQFDEIETVKAEKLVLEMNLEQLNHQSNKRFEVAKNKITRLTSENNSLQESVGQFKKSAAAYDEKISTLEIEKNSLVKKSHETDQLVDTLEKEKTHLFEIIHRREEENKTFKAELEQLSKNNKELRNELVNLETLTQRSSSELLKIKFDKNNLNQELEILKKNSSWYETELNKKMEELKTFKVDKYKEFSALQLELDSTKSSLQSLNSKYDNLKHNFDSVSKKLDDSLVTVKNLNDKIAYNKEDFLKEMSSKDKLIEILNKSNEERKERVQFLQANLDSVKTGNVSDASGLQAQLEQAQKNLQASNTKIKQLEGVIDELTSGNGHAGQAASIPSTPRILKQFQQQDIPLSPSAQQTLAKLGGGISLTQLYSDFQLMKKQLIKERRLKENLEKQVNQFVEELNKQVPAISATRERSAMLEAELTDISILLEKTSREKDLLFKENKNWSKKLNEYELELKTLNTSKLDLSKQISYLVIQLSLKADGDAPLTAREREFIDKLVEDQSNNYNDESDTDKLISERLVRFNSVVDLTTKNQELLKITRQLGNQLENQEKLNQQKLDNLESIAIDEAREAIIVLQEQITSTEGKLNSVTRERDMFRSIAGGHKQANVFNSTPNNSGLELKDLTSRHEGLETELEQVQDEFKLYKKETESTIKVLNKQISDLNNAKSDLALQLARATSSSQLFEDRYKSIQETLRYSKSETEEIRKRSNMLQDSLSKHDLVNQQLTEELIQTKSLTESLSLEVSNLKAERQLWKSIEKRLNEENSSLLDERLRLNSLTSDLQRLENERDKNFNESTSRLNTTISSLENELTQLKSKLESNTEELSSALLRKDADAKAYQERIESLRNELSSTREDLFKRKQVSDSLEAKVENLRKELADRDQQLNAYESTDGIDSEEGDVELKLRQNLQKTKVELENALSDLSAANESVEQFKAVANAAESRLAELSDSYDQYKQSVESKLADSTEENSRLVQQITMLTNDISQLQSKLSEFQSERDGIVSSLKEEIESLKVKAASTDEVRNEYEAKVELIKQDLAQQAKIAQECQQNYEQELQKHAEVSKVNTKLREEESQLKIKIQELSIESRDNKLALVSSQESWENQKMSLEEELKVAESRVGDLNLQNRMLLNQLEQVTKQQRDSYDAAHLESNSAMMTTTGADTNLEGSSEELLQVVSFLRHEKEISDAQLEVSKQEQKRLQQNLEITRQELEDVKVQLIKLQTREEHSGQLEQNYKDLKEKIVQLDIFRESNNTLRQESQRYSAQVKTLEDKLSANIAKLEPLEFQVVNLKAELETKTKELDSERSIVEFWKNKNQEILQNYNRIDPEEHNELKARVQELTPYVSKAQELQKNLSDLETGYQNERKKSIREANDRLTKFKGIIDATKKELTEEKQRTTELQQEVEALQKKLESNGSVDEAAIADGDDGKSQQAALLAKELEETKALLSSATADASKRLEEFTRTRDQLVSEVADLQAKLANASAVANGDSGDTASLRAAFEKEKADLIQQKDKELEQAKFKLRIEIKKELESQQDNNELRKQLEAEHAKDVEAKVKEACDQLKAKIREPHEAKINAIVNKRFEKLKQEADIEIKKREEELVKKYASGSSSAELQDEITKLKESIDAECKKAKEEGRSSALKEGEMRYKMTKRQLDRAKEELAKLKNGTTAAAPQAQAPAQATAQQQTNPSIPMKPVLNNTSKIPTHNFRENLKKPAVLKPADEEDKGVKRVAEETGDESAEKKTKTE